MMGPRAKGPRAKALAVAGGLACALVMIACQPGEPPPQSAKPGHSALNS